MSPLVEALNFYLSLGTVLTLLGVFVVVVDWKLFRGENLVKYVAPFSTALALVLTLSGIALTLLYSEVFGFLPCGLCWLERVFLYPQAVIIALALWYGEKRWSAIYGIALSVLGAIIALYHHYIQMGGSEFVKCPATGVSCSQRIVFEFGFVTFPFMAFALFLALGVLYVIALRFRREG